MAKTQNTGTTPRPNDMRQPMSAASRPSGTAIGLRRTSSLESFGRLFGVFQCADTMFGNFSGNLVTSSTPTASASTLANSVRKSLVMRHAIDGHEVIHATLDVGVRKVVALAVRFKRRPRHAAFG